MSLKYIIDIVIIPLALSFLVLFISNYFHLDLKFKRWGLKRKKHIPKINYVKKEFENDSSPSSVSDFYNLTNYNTSTNKTTKINPLESITFFSYLFSFFIIGVFLVTYIQIGFTELDYELAVWIISISIALNIILAILKK
jgi:hypothetical protein